MGSFSNFQSSRGCEEYQCEDLITQKRSVKDLPPPETKGIFVIKENSVIIYVGKSDDCMRERMLSHISGYDAQIVGEYMKKMNKEYKESHVTIGWVSIRKPKCEEHHYIQCIADRQGNWPKLNLKRGRPKKDSGTVGNDNKSAKRMKKE